MRSDKLLADDADAVLRGATSQLACAGVSSPAHDAAALLAHSWQVSRAELGRLRLRGTAVPGPVLKSFHSALKRRAAREPLQHIVGHAHFRHLTLDVGPGVFIPRPETELLVGFVIAWVKLRTGPIDVYDLCAGTGALGLALATERPQTHVTAVEVSPQAVDYLRANVERYSADLTAVESSVTVVLADALTFEPVDKAHIVVANPPYVDRAQQPRSPEVELYDPALALYGGGVAGMDFPRALIERAPRALKPGGLLALEHAEYQTETIQAAFHVAGFEHVKTHPDYTDRDRFTTGMYRGEDTYGARF